MNYQAKSFRILIIGIIMCGFTSCMDDPMRTENSLNPDTQMEGENEISALSNEEGENLRTSPGGLTDQPNPSRLPVPTVTFQEFIPSYELWANHKSLTWRIEWPVYNAGVSANAIPTAFARGNGSLKSFNFLNSTDPLNTINTSFSLYYDQTLEGTIHMWQELDHVPLGGIGMEWIKFAKMNISVSTLKHWIEDRPGLLEAKMPEISEHKVSYNEGDIFLYEILGKNLYGGIRIVSMSPRIIEVYLAVPNI
jgi:hypothetical protein